MISFLIGFLILICVLVCVVILVKWLLAVAGIAVPQPLMIVASIIVFLILFLMLLNYSGVYRFSLGH